MYKSYHYAKKLQNKLFTGTMLKQKLVILSQ